MPDSVPASTLRRSNQPLGSYFNLTRFTPPMPSPFAGLSPQFASLASTARMLHEPRFDAIDLTGAPANAGRNTLAPVPVPTDSAGEAAPADSAMLPLPLSDRSTLLLPNIAALSALPVSAAAVTASDMSEIEDFALVSSMQLRPPSPVQQVVSPVPLSTVSPMLDALRGSAPAGLTAVARSSPSYLDRDEFDLALPAPTAVQSRDAHQFASLREPLRRSFGSRSAFSQRPERSATAATTATSASASSATFASAQSTAVIGYDPSLFIEPPVDSRELEELTCIICSCIVRAPLNSKCGCIFCGACLTTAYASRRCCPSCKTPFVLSECHVNNYLVKKVWACKVRCPKHTQGCTAQYVIGVKDRNVVAHAAQCEFIELVCDFCNETMPKHRLDAHINESVGLHMRLMKEKLSEMDQEVKSGRESARRSEVEHVTAMARQRSELKAYHEAMKEETKRYVKQQVRRYEERAKQRGTRRHEQLLSAFNRITQPSHAAVNFYQHTFTGVDSDAQQWLSPRFVIAGREYALRLVRSGEGEEQTLRLELTYHGRVYDLVKAQLTAADEAEVKEDRIDLQEEEKRAESRDDGSGTASTRRVPERSSRAPRARDPSSDRVRERILELERDAERHRQRERERLEVERRREREQREMEAEQRVREREQTVRDWDRQQQRRQQQREELLRERERVSRQPPQRDYALESFRDFPPHPSMDASNPFSLPGTGASPVSNSQPRRRRSVRWSDDSPFAPTDQAERLLVEHLDDALIDATAATQSAAARAGDADGSFDAFEMRTWQPSSAAQPARVMIRFFVYDRPGRLPHYAPSSASALPSVIYSSTCVLNVTSDLLGACVSSGAVALADSEGDGMRRGWMNSVWKSVSAAVLVDDALDSAHGGGGLEYTAADYLHATLRHRAGGVKREGEGDGEAEHGGGHGGVSGQLYMEDLTGEEQDGMERMMAAAEGEASGPSLPVPMKRRRIED